MLCDSHGLQPFCAGYLLRIDRPAQPRLPVAIVSSDEDPQIIREALSLGAAGYLPKSTSRSESALSIERVRKLFSRNKAVIEIGKTDLPVPKQQVSRLERAEPI